MIQNELEGPLAPLIVQQVASDTSQVHADRFGLLEQSADGWTVNPATPTVYFERSVVQIRDRPYEQLAFVWWYAAGNDVDHAPVMRGFRMTLDSNGYPCIWELLGDGLKQRVLYVSRSLETAAKAEFGGPLASRRFAIERSLTEAPTIVVARVLEDGPVPMGPFVYLDGASNEITTLLCRCMASQVDRFVETDYYDLLPVELLPELTGVGKVPRPPRVESYPPPLEQLLRLPAQF